MQKIDALGEMCPIPVVRAKKALAEIESGTLEVLVDNEIAVSNIKRLAGSLECGFEFEKENDQLYKIIIEKRKESALDKVKPTVVSVGKTVVAVSSNLMGAGDEALGKNLMKGFIYALTQLENLPDTILFYNSGAFLTSQDSASLPDLTALEQAGVSIMTCGACLNHYAIADKLGVGTVTNMYAIVEAMNESGRIIRP